MENSTLLWEKTEQNVFCNIVSAGFQNAMPSGIAVSITHIKAKFNYQDGSSEIKEKNVNIPPQADWEVLLSSCSDKCVKSIVGTMTVLDQQGGQRREVVLEKTRFADGPTGCLLGAKFPLAKNLMVDANVLQEFRKTGDVSIFLVIE